MGKWLVGRAPALTSLARKAYSHLPESWHDTPTSRLSAFYAASENVTFLQVGAYDGVAGDPLHAIVAEDERWHGVLVEPQRQAFQRLKQNYRSASHRLYFLNCAISDTSGEAEFYYVAPKIIEYAGLPAYYAELASFDRSHIAKHAPGVPIETLIVRTWTAADALKIAGYEKADCLVLDVEGCEGTLLENIDFDQLGVSFIIFEHKHLSTVDMTSIAKRLRTYGFEMKEFGRDVIAWRSANI